MLCQQVDRQDEMDKFVERHKTIETDSRQQIWIDL